MRSIGFPWRPRSLGSYSVGDSLDSGWGFVVRGSYCLCSFLYNFLVLALYSCLCSWELECRSSIAGHLTSCIVACFVLEGGGCSIEGVVAEGQSFGNFCFLQIRF